MRVLFLFIGEPHHVFHSLPIAAEMAKMGGNDLNIEIAVAGDAHLPMVDQVKSACPGFLPKLVMLGQHGPAHWLRRSGLVRNPRIPLLLGALRYLRNFDAIVVPERTTTAIRHLLRRKTKLIFTPHGAGDRAITFDSRDRHFDFALVAGEKSEKRMLEEGTIRPGRYAMTGYVKLDFMRRIHAQRQPLFNNERPTILYSPHFRHSLSSWDRFGEGLIRWFKGQDRYNLVVAPHVRLFAEATEKRISEVMALSEPGKILIDLQSYRLFDMTYTSAADIYVGDVSSQVYEFISKPRPCIFLNAHSVKWQGDPNYLFWTLGDVITTLGELPDALDVAAVRHPLYLDAQRKTLTESIGGDPSGAARNAADAIIRFLAKQSDADNRPFP